MTESTSEQLYRWLLEHIEEEFTWDEIQSAFGWAVSRKHAKRAARLAEADNLCLVVPSPENGWALFLTADPSRALQGSWFLGAVEDGVRDRRLLHDDFITSNARGSQDPDVRRLARSRRRERQITELFAEEQREMRELMKERRREAQEANGQ